MLLYALGWFVVFHLFEVAFDEKVLATGFPDYQPYIERTPRWLPRRPRL
jgi:protein-S-isoprenylcysteine O-methyltransferase Ste14